MGEFQRFMAFDFETANHARSSACALGCVIVHGIDDWEAHYFKIKPKILEVSPIHKGLHGLSEDDLESCDEWPIVWQKVSGWFSSMPVVAHNLSFDMSVLRETSTLYGITLPEISGYCSMKLLKLNMPDLSAYNLFDVCMNLNIDLSHHEADSDALACAEIIVLLLKETGATNLIEIAKSIPAIPLASTSFDASTEVVAHPYTNGRTFCLTGYFACGVKADIASRIERGGGIIHDSVKKSTNVLVVGGCSADGWVGEEYGSAKLRRARDLVAKGSNINITSEGDFVKALTIEPSLNESSY